MSPPPAGGEDVGAGWDRFKNYYGAPCATCGHPKWQHLGLRRTECTNLGACRCRAFKSGGNDDKETET